ncbi:hypothetical protein ACIRBX_17755 [Kitasatospora sp. NPDC096147]|uniref:hypothetical protein n=1 Tax=Kitasatospora sp. NPDC096147 TaxID=3364093 RepID=UPI00382884AC
MTTPPTPEADPTVRLGKQDTPLPLGPVRSPATPAEGETVQLRPPVDESTMKLAPGQVPPDATVRLSADAAAPELTVRLTPAAAAAPAPHSSAVDSTVKLGAGAVAEDSTVKLGAGVVAAEATVKLTAGAGSDPDSTVKLPPSVPGPEAVTVKLPPGGLPLDATAELTATALTERLDRTQPQPLPTAPPTTPQPAPQPVAAEAPAPDAGLRRFGPGVPPQAAAVWHGTAGQEPPPRPRRRGRWALFLLILLLVLAVLGWFAWQRYGRPVAVDSVSVRTGSTDVACDGTQTVTATLETNGGAGDVSYRWLRSDGTDSGALTQAVPSGRHSTQLTLRWSFHGQGTLDATATLQVDSPSAHSSAVSFRYACP